MRAYYIPIVVGLVTGCSTHQHTSSVAPVVLPPASPLVQVGAATRVVETRYEVRGYRDADDPSVRHGAHAVYRMTRVPERIEELYTAPRSEFAPISYAPLAPSAELAAELAAQKEIGAELRAIQSRMAEVEEQARTQLGTLT